MSCRDHQKQTSQAVGSEREDGQDQVQQVGSGGGGYRARVHLDRPAAGLKPVKNSSSLLPSSSSVQCPTVGGCRIPAVYKSYVMAIKVSEVSTTSFAGQKPGTSGLRKKVVDFFVPNYLENFVQCTLSAVGLDRAQEGGSILVVGGDGRFGVREVAVKIVQMAAANGVCIKCFLSFRGNLRGDFILLGVKGDRRTRWHPLHACCVQHHSQVQDNRGPHPYSFPQSRGREGGFRN